MASPQIEDGHIDIAHEIAEALMRTNLSSYQTRILWAIWRQTYGWHKKEDWISNSQLTKMTGLAKGHVSRTVKELKERNMVTNSGNKISFNKDYTQWRELPKGVRGYQHVVTYSGNDSRQELDANNFNKLPIGEPVTNSGKIVTNSGKIVTNSGGHKRNYTKETIQKKFIYPQWFEDSFWKPYPSRRGVKVGKKECYDYIIQYIPEEDKEDLFSATRNYANHPEIKAGFGIKDPIRFLKKDFWRDWVGCHQQLQELKGKVSSDGIYISPVVPEQKAKEDQERILWYEYNKYCEQLGKSIFSQYSQEQYIAEFEKYKQKLLFNNPVAVKRMTKEAFKDSIESAMEIEAAKANKLSFDQWLQQKQEEHNNADTHK